MRKLLSIALIAALIVSATPLIGINIGVGNTGVVYAETIPIDEEHFPDEAFRNSLTGMYGSSFDPTTVTSLDVSSRHIENLEGIQLFSALEYLNCCDNYLCSLDVSYNKALEVLYCSDCKLNSLDVSHNTALKRLDCSINDLKSFDASNNTALEYLNCRKSYLSSLDISNNTALEYLECNENSLSELDISQNTALVTLNCSINNLSSLDVSNNTALVDLWCASNNLSSLDVENNIALEVLWCASNNLSSLDVENNTALTCLNCDFCNLSNLDVSHNTALREFHCDANSLNSLNVSNNTALEYLWCASNNLNSLDVSSNTTLNYLDCSSNNLGKLYVGNKTPDTCHYDEGVEIIYGVAPTYGIGSFAIGNDSNNFCNAADSKIFKNCGFKEGKFYNVLDYNYYRKLLALESGGDKHSLGQQTRIAIQYWSQPIGGICYGAAATMSMLKSGDLNISDLSNGNATSYYQLGSPVDDHKFGQMIYYYVLSQFSSSQSLSTLTSVQKDGVTGFSKTLVSALQKDDKPYTINIPGHTWIVTEVETNIDGSYTVEMFDENTVYRSYDTRDPHYCVNGYFTYMNISSDYKSLSFNYYNGEKYYADVFDGIYRYDDMGDKVKTDNIWICDPSKLDPAKIPLLKAESLYETLLKNCNTISFWNKDSISITNSEGETMSYDASDGCISGDMGIGDIRTINYGENYYEYIVYIPKSDSYQVDSQNSDVDISFSSEDNMIAIKGTNINNVALDSNLNAVVEGGLDGYTFDIASAVRNDNNDVGLDLINVRGEASGPLEATNTGEAFCIQSDSTIEKVNAVIHSDNKSTETDLDDVTTVNVEAGNNITSDAQNGQSQNSDDVEEEGSSEANPSSKPSVAPSTPTKIIDLPAVKIIKPKAGKKSATIKWKKISAKNRKKISKVQIQFSTDKKFKKKVKSVYAKKSTVSKKIKKLKSKKKYYFRIRAYKKFGGVVHVSKWSKVKKVTIK